jgi:membrane-associated phospholipid phosphatase
MLSLPIILWHQLRDGDVVLAIALVLLPLAATCTVARRTGYRPLGRRTGAIEAFSWNIGLLLGLEQAYEFARGSIPSNRDVAFLHSYRVLDLEWQHGLFVEARIERFFLQWTPVMQGFDVFYAVGHAVGTIGILVWLYTKRREHFAFIRNMFAVTTGLALIVFTLYPTAPPRMFPNYGFADPEQLTHLVAAGGAQLNSYTYDPYAAMPSLHVTYAILVALGLIIAERRRWVRVLGALYPFLMAATVIISANHWILDVVGAFVTVGISWLVLLGLGRARSRLSGFQGVRMAPRAEAPTSIPLAVHE